MDLGAFEHTTGGVGIGPYGVDGGTTSMPTPDAGRDATVEPRPRRGGGRGGAGGDAGAGAGAGGGAGAGAGAGAERGRIRRVPAPRSRAPPAAVVE